MNTIRAWKDSEYRETLSAEELALLPEHPAGQIELSEEDLLNVVGGNGGATVCQNISVCINSVLCD
ncbi:MAG TPA: mersacidin/lichenicidin family type 2 lantibiotic [Ktedonobacteraceae bacterium]|nr:mersacidin/lichenicidin family type 2 lantibiotic [Ktedonobacteraceae bacterium]HZO76126.1 mersacidin/lichenicidin family type 2 lantibiotic [Ktedonobacteraceae bacterium]